MWRGGRVGVGVWGLRPSEVWGWGLGRLRVCHIVGLGREGIGGKAGGAGLVGSELVCAWKNRNTDGNFPVKYGNRRYGQESPLTASAPVPAVFSRVFSCFLFFYQYGIRSVYTGFGAGRDGIFPFSTLAALPCAVSRNGNLKATWKLPRSLACANEEQREA